MSNTQIKKCPRCGNSFGCCSDSDCWCETEQVSSKAVKFLQMTYVDCVCRNCMRQTETDLNR